MLADLQAGEIYDDDLMRAEFRARLGHWVLSL
jgi:hypothetical protein